MLQLIRDLGQRAQAATARDVVGPDEARPGSGGSQLELAALHADMGTIVSAETRLRFVKRAMARLLRHFTHHQVAFNHAILQELAAAREALSAPAPPDQHRDERLAFSLAALDVQVECLQDQVRALEELAGAPPGPGPGPGTSRSVEGFDEFYLAFEDSFRGTRQVVMRRAEEYLDDLKSITGSGGRVLDLGTGRGELLELLTGHGIDAYGVDSSERMVDSCRGRGLEVIFDDAVVHLRGLPDGSLAAVTAMHVVEHLDLEVLFELVGESRRVLQPAGRIILESPNPTTWQVGANLFYLDPTHLRPVHPLFLEFLLAKRGFDDLEVRFLHRAEATRPVAESLDPALLQFVERFAEMYGGPQDYAVLGTRPADP